MLLRNPLMGIRTFAASGTAADSAEANGEAEKDDVDPTDEAAGGADPEEGDDSGEGEEETAVEEAVAEKSLRDFGFETDDPEQLSSSWKSMEARLAQAEQNARYMQWLHAQQLQQQQKPAEQPAPAKPKAPWDLPEFDRKWIELVERDANGNLVAKPGAQPDLPQKIQAYAAARESVMDQFFRDPVGSLREHMAPMIQEQAQQIAARMYQEQKLRADFAQFEQQNRELYLNPDGTPNSLGVEWNKHFQAALQSGFSDPIQYAQDRIDALLFRAHLADENAKAAGRQREQTAVEKDAAKKLAFLKGGAANKANRGLAGKGRGAASSKAGINAFDKLRQRWKGRDPKEFEEDLHADDE